MTEFFPENAATIERN